MAYDTGAGAAAAAAATVVSRAIRAAGAIVRVSPGDFMEIIQKDGHSLVIKARGGFFKPNYQYLTSYKGFVFYTKSKAEMVFPPEVEFINAREIWIPS